MYSEVEATLSHEAPFLRPMMQVYVNGKGEANLYDQTSITFHLTLAQP
jgi:hypothetical protein